jgi:hypothetical protein
MEPLENVGSSALPKGSVHLSSAMRKVVGPQVEDRKTIRQEGHGP